MEEETVKAAEESVADKLAQQTQATTEQGMEVIQNLIDTVVEFCVNYSFQVVGAIIILILGVMAANWVSKVLFKNFQKKEMDITLSKFLVSVVKILVLTFAIIIALGKFGISIDPFVAAIGAVAFGASFAIAGPLANYGAGISIILARPFIVGDTITIAGQSGIVQEVKLASTVLKDEEGITITIPNKHIVGEVLENSQKNRIVQGEIGISYDADPEKAIRIIQEQLQKFEDVNTEEKPRVGIKEFGDSSVNIAYRYWVPTVKYFQTSYAVNMAIYKAFGEVGINIPFPQRDVRIVSQTTNEVTV